MKSLIAVLVFLTALTTAAQTPAKVTLELGSVTVWLGMPKADVLSACAVAGYRAIENKDDGRLTILTDTTKNARLYSVYFKAGRVSYADRSWLSNGQGEFEAVLGLLATLDGRTCLLSHDPINKPDMKVDRVFINCGSRSVLITKGTINVAGEIAAGTTVSERIGTF